jgi:hypothetical protein
MRSFAFVTMVAAVFASANGLVFAQHHDHAMQRARGDPAMADVRELVHFPDAMREHMLGNMRDHLKALQEINEAMGRGNANAAARIAEQRLGMSAMKLHGAHEIAPFMPQGMQDVGASMHHAASRFAIALQDAETSDDLKPALSALGDVMGACVGCHARYRVH